MGSVIFFMRRFIPNFIGELPIVEKYQVADARVFARASLGPLGTPLDSGFRRNDEREDE